MRKLNVAVARKRPPGKSRTDLSAVGDSLTEAASNSCLGDGAAAEQTSMMMIAGLRIALFYWMVILVIMSFGGQECSKLGVDRALEFG
jgi:hypothetical protein